MLTEKETILRAKNYLEKLSQGINPLTDAPVPEYDTVRIERISKCLSYAAMILGKVTEQPDAKNRYKKQPFSLTREEIEKYNITTPLPVTEIRNCLNSLSDGRTANLKSESVTGWLINNGYLVRNTDPQSKPRFIPTDKGKDAGIYIETRHGIHGDYGVVMYDCAAQQLILDNIGEIAELNISSSTRKPPKPSAIPSETKITPESDPGTEPYSDRIVGLYRSGSSIAAIAHILKIDYKVIKNCLIEAGLLRSSAP